MGDLAAERLMLLDTASLYFRAFYGLPESMTAPNGMPVNAVRGLLDMIARLVADHSPTRLVACWDDDWRPAFRVAAIPSYKAHRVAEVIAVPDDGTEYVEETPDTLSPQVPVIAEFLEALGIARVGAPGYEADDVIGTLTHAATCPVDIVTGDRDLFQLVRDDQPVRVLYTVKGLGNLDLVDEARVSERYGIPGRAYADFAILRGDPSDGLPGVPGVGEKTAASLVSSIGGVEDIVAAATSGVPVMPPGPRAKVLSALDYLAVAGPVVRVALDAPVAAHDDALPSLPADPAGLRRLVEAYGLASPVSRLLAVLGGQASG